MELPKMLFFLFAVSIGFTIATPDASRIHGGLPAAEGQFKYMAQLKFTGRSYPHPGSIISNQWILTTALLASNAKPEDVTVIVGTTKMDDENAWRYAVSDILVPPFNPSNTSNIALVKVKGHIILGGNVATIMLSSPTGIPPNLTTTIAGWGNTGPLLYIKLNTITTTECNTNLTSGKLNPAIHFCTAPMGINGPCSYDEGAPLVYTNYVIGLPDEPYCGGNSPRVFLKIAVFGDWIKQVAGVGTRSSKIV